MARTIAARFDTEAEAEEALSRVASEVTLLDSAVLSDGVAATLTLDGLSLAPEERSACELQLKQGGFLLIAQAPEDRAAAAVLRLLHGAPGASGAQVLSASPASPGEEPVQEERIPIVEEELRIGKREVLRGGARVHSYTAEVPVQEQVELFEEETSIVRRPVNRRLTDEEVVRGGLLQERVVEISQMREEAVVSKEAFVREELVVTKSVEQRIEQINETVRRTEVETEGLQPGVSNTRASSHADDRPSPNPSRS